MSDWHPETLHVLGAISSKRVVPPAKVTVESLLYAQLSYAMSGEDSFIAKHFKDRLHARNPGVYVDIGAGAIWDISNSFMFYGHGWSGLCLDANPHNAGEWKQWRPRDRSRDGRRRRGPRAGVLARAQRQLGYGAGDTGWRGAG